MYGSGSGTPPIVPVVAGVGTAAVLPRTGSTTVEIAIALAAGLVAWAVVYTISAKFSKR